MRSAFMGFGLFVSLRLLGVMPSWTEATWGQVFGGVLLATVIGVAAEK